MTIKHLAYRLAHEFTGGAVALSRLMGKGEKVLQNKLNPNSTTHYLTIDELEMLADFTDGNLAIAEYFADKANAVVVQLPDVPDMGDMALLDAYMNIMKELGELSSEFQSSYADGVITSKEFKKISIDVNAVISKAIAFQAAVKRVAQ